MELTLLGGAFLAGFLSFISPCVLPLLPTFSLILAKNSQQDASTPIQLHSSRDLRSFLFCSVRQRRSLEPGSFPIRISCGRERPCSSS